MKAYKNINDPQKSFVSPFVDRHSEKNKFFASLNALIDWKIIAKELELNYSKGHTDRGAKAYSPVLLFKMHLLSKWYDMSDHQTEYMVNDSISAMKFCGLTLEDQVPGHSTLSRFKRELSNSHVLLDLEKKIETLLKAKGYKIRSGKARTEARLQPAKRSLTH